MEIDDRVEVGDGTWKGKGKENMMSMKKKKMGRDENLLTDELESRMKMMMKKKMGRDEEDSTDKLKETRINMLMKKKKMGRDEEDSTDKFKLKETKILLRQSRNLSKADVEGEVHVKLRRDLPEGDNSHPRPAWAVVTWNGSEFSVSRFDKYRDDHGVNMFPYPKYFPRLEGNTSLVFNSNYIYFTAGIYRGGPAHNLQSYVFCFDIFNKKWEPCESMQTPRCFHVAVPVGDSIYVFGNSDGGPESCRIPPEHWGERFLTKHNTWDYLPDPPRLLYLLHWPRAYAVYHTCQAFKYTSKDDIVKETFTYSVKENQNLILFLLPDYSSPISVFNCNSNEWLPNIYPNLPTSAPPIFPYKPQSLHPDQLVVVHGVLIWHHDGNIHGYDFINQKYHKSLFHIPNRQRPKFDGCCSSDTPMYLVQPVDHKLCLFFQRDHDRYIIHYVMFDIVTDQKQGEQRTFRLVQQAKSFFSTKLIGHDYLTSVHLL